jgi:polyhydroxyalkanoate synthase subunit PhaE
MSGEANRGSDLWMDAQRQIWDSWMDVARRGPAAAFSPPQPPRGGPWAEAIDQWWKSVSPATPPSSREVLDRMVQMGRGYIAMAEVFSSNGPSSGPSADPMQWVEDWNRTFWSGMKDWTPPWATESAGGFDAFKGMDPSAAVHRMLDMPAIGYSREAQEDVQKAGQLLLEYQKAAADYRAGFLPLGPASMTRLQSLMTARTETKGPITQLRELFDLWVDASEDVYQDYALSSDYALRYGKMVNAQMALRNQMQHLRDEWLAAQGLPAARDLSGLQERLQETRREVHRVRSRMEALEARLADLEANRIEPAPAPATPPAKPRARKAASPKSSPTSSSEGAAS